MVTPFYHTITFTGGHSRMLGAPHLFRMLWWLRGSHVRERAVRACKSGCVVGTPPLLCPDLPRIEMPTSLFEFQEPPDESLRRNRPRSPGPRCCGPRTYRTDGFLNRLGKGVAHVGWSRPHGLRNARASTFSQGMR